MKKLIYGYALFITAALLFVLFAGCSSSVNTPEIETFKFEIKYWGTIASRNMASNYEPWNRKPGIKVAYLILNKDDRDLKIEYSLQIWVARSQADVQTLIPIEEAPFISSTPGLICAKTNPNLDPFEIIESGVILLGEKAFGISFAPVNWDENFSIWSTVTIMATESSLSKGTYRMWEITTEPIEVKL